MKKIILSLILAVVLGGFFANSAHATDFTITIDNNQATANQQFVFQYSNIGPGFSSDAPIDIINNASSSAEVKLISIAPVNQPVSPAPAPANNLLPYVDLSLSRDGVTVAQGTAADTSSLIGATFCVPAEQTDQLMTHFSLPTSVGNEAQNTSLYINYTFQVSIGPCGIVAPPGTGPAVTPPNTSETSLPFLVMGGTCLTAFIVALLFATFLFIPFLRRKRNDKKYARKY